MQNQLVNNPFPPNIPFFNNLNHFYNTVNYLFIFSILTFLRIYYNVIIITKFDN